MPTEERLDEAVEKITALSNYFLGDPAICDDKGWGKRVEEHLTILNSRTSKSENRLNNLDAYCQVNNERWKILKTIVLVVIVLIFTGGGSYGLSLLV